MVKDSVGEIDRARVARLGFHSNVDDEVQRTWGIVSSAFWFFPRAPIWNVCSIPYTQQINIEPKITIFKRKVIYLNTSNKLRSFLCILYLEFLHHLTLESSGPGRLFATLQSIRRVWTFQPLESEDVFKSSINPFFPMETLRNYENKRG